jgi:hypothetical protein
MLCFVEYGKGKGYSIVQLDSMGAFFARAVAGAWSLTFDRILHDVLQKSKPPLLVIIAGRIGHQNHGGPSQEYGG